MAMKSQQEWRADEYVALWATESAQRMHGRDRIGNMLQDLLADHQVELLEVAWRRTQVECWKF